MKTNKRRKLVKSIICLVKGHIWWYNDKYNEFRYLYSTRRCSRCGKKEYYGYVGIQLKWAGLVPK